MLYIYIVNITIIYLYTNYNIYILELSSIIYNTYIYILPIIIIYLCTNYNIYVYIRANFNSL